MFKRFMMYAGKVGVWGIGALGTFYIGLFLYGYWYDEWSGYNASLYVSNGVCNVAVLPIQGEIVGYEHAYGDDSTLALQTSPEDVRAFLSRIRYDSLIEGVVLRIDSTGGSPAGAIAIADAIHALDIPVLAFIGDYGVSAGYLIATAADTIVGTPFSDVGSIGVTMSYVSNAKQNEYDGLEYISLTSAPFKDYGTPDKELTNEERKLFERDLAIYHDAFVKIVSENRGIEQADVAMIADGSSMPATLALEKKLIDSVGDTDDVRAWFAEKLGLSVGDIILCE